MSIFINGSAGVTHKFTRKAKDLFSVEPDFRKSVQRTGTAWNLEFNDKFVLSARDSGQTGYRIDFSDRKGHNRIVVSSENHGERAPIASVDFDTPLAQQDGRRLALQVASALIQVPFLEKMLELPVPSK